MRARRAEQVDAVVVEDDDAGKRDDERERLGASALRHARTDLALQTDLLPGVTARLEHPSLRGFAADRHPPMMACSAPGAYVCV